MMSSYKLTYFNFTGLGEPVRFMLSYAGIDFEDKRVSDEEWPQYKPLMPMEQLPVLEIDGKKYNQSLAICRLIAKKSNVYGRDDIEALQIDSAVNNINDLRHEMANYFWNTRPEWTPILKERAFERLAFYLDKFEAILNVNNGYFVSNKLTWADIFFASLHDYMCSMAERDITADHPKLKNIANEVFNLPNIKSYLANRPKTKF